jgi:hypothetical protein
MISVMTIVISYLGGSSNSSNNRRIYSERDSDMPKSKMKLGGEMILGYCRYL